ncbi:MAG: N-acetylmuramoyl-L-alanine amidase [Mycoplasmatota bacterium]
MLIKCKIKNLFFTILLIISFGFLESKTQLVFFIDELPLIDKVIYIDPGHGGIDPGAVYKDLLEDEINLKISIQLKYALESKGAIVYLTRSGDYDLASPDSTYRKQSDLLNRSILINESNCDLFISIHLNSVTSSTWSGAQVFYDAINESNKYLAESIQESLKNDISTTREASLLENMYMLKNTTTLGVLVEVGFLSNENDRYLLTQDDYHIKVSNSITNGIIDYFY